MLVEVMISIVVLGIVFTALALAMQEAFLVTRQTKDLQVATQLVNERLEQVRAIATDTLMAGAGLSEVQSAVTGGQDSLLTGSGPYAYNGEILLTSDSPVSGTPLSPYRSEVTTDNVTYTLSTYATRCYQPAASPGTCNAASGADTDKALIRVTVVANWTPPGATMVRSVSNQSIVFSPTSCLSTSTHPFSAPCQSFMYAGANAGGGTISIQGYDAADPAVPGPILATSGLKTLEVRPPEAVTSLQVEQVGRVQATASGSTYLEDGQLAGGGVAETALATSDPAQASDSSSGSLSAPAISASVARDNGLTISTAGAGATGSVVADMSADGTPDCPSASGITQSTGTPVCAGSSLTSSGTTSVSLAGTVDAVNLATTVASIAAPASVSRAHVGGYTAANPGSMCAAATSAGCAAGDLRSVAGAVQIGGLPVGLSAPSGWLGAAVLVDANQADATAQRGPGVTTEVDPTVSGSSPVLRVWTGSGYVSVPLTTTTAQTSWTIPAVSVSGSGLTFELRDPPGPGGEVASTAGTVTLGDRLLTNEGSSDCTAVCTQVGAIGPLTVTLNYEIKRGSGSLGRFVVNATVFQQQARAVFEPASESGS